MPVTSPSTFVWSPPPVAGGISVEELWQLRHKLVQSNHVVVIHRLFAMEWKKQLHKAANLVLTLPAGHPAWPASMHEPLTISILFPFIYFLPSRDGPDDYDHPPLYVPTDTVPGPINELYIDRLRTFNMSQKKIHIKKSAETNFSRFQF